MAPDAPRQNGYAYLAARARIEEQILQVAKARGITVRVEVDRRSSEVADHPIQLSYARSKRTVVVDHETFMSEEFFRTLVLHQVQAVIDELAMSASVPAMSTRVSEVK